MEFNLLSLPAQIQIAAASGYAAYMTASIGIRAHHTTTQTAFTAAAYGLIATAVLASAPDETNPIAVGVLAFVLTVFAGMFWRKIGCRVWFGLLSFLGVSRADDTPSAWMALHERADSYLTQIAIELDDGTWLYCDDTTKFAKAPQGPCVLGANGDIGMYLTHQKRQGAERTAVLTTRDARWGDRLTWIPASRIRRVSLRQRPKD